MIKVNVRSGGMVIRGGVATFTVLAGLGLFAAYRPWQLKWGATPDEINAKMPGDDLVSAPIFNATRAVTIDAPPEAIWPWLVQIGFGRAGWYSYDLLDNLGRGSAECIIPGFQHVAVGDLVPLGPGGDSGMRIKAFDPNRWMLWWDRKIQRTSWAWALDVMPDGRTRLVTRVRARPSWHHPTTAAWLVLTEVADFPMMRKCLLGIKRRAEVTTVADGFSLADAALHTP